MAIAILKRVSLVGFTLPFSILETVPGEKPASISRVNWLQRCLARSFFILLPKLLAILWLSRLLSAYKQGQGLEKNDTSLLIPKGMHEFVFIYTIQYASWCYPCLLGTCVLTQAQ